MHSAVASVTAFLSNSLTETINMNDLNLLLAQNENFKFVEVVFNHTDKHYVYKTALDVEVGDSLVVEAPSGFKVVEVKAVLKFNELCSSKRGIKLKWVVQKVDTTEYERCKKAENDAQQHLDTARVSKMREELEASLTQQIGADALKEVKALVRL